MPQKVMLQYNETTESVVVNETHFHEDGRVLMKGCDPSFYPESMTDHLQFYSSELTTIVRPTDNVSVKCVEPTDSPVPEPDPSF